ncbi:MAG: hypothetical protein OIF47_16640 [Marinibacterium sp.]|nr:hypothetical protein [Marinibacterium sp.]
MTASDIVTKVLDALRQELGDGLSAIEDFAKAQGEKLANIALTLAEGRIDGDFDEADIFYQRLLDRLERRTALFARQLVQMAALTIEQAWNAVAGAIWDAINGLLAGIGLPLSLPEQPSI